MPKARSLSASAIPAILRLIEDKAPATTMAELDYERGDYCLRCRFALQRLVLDTP